jgi:Protein of unknown function (DUF2505)
MDFRVEQTYNADPDLVAHAYTDPALYDAVGEVSRLGRPEVLDRREEGDVVTLQIRYRFTGDLSSAARAVLDPAKLTWVEHSAHDLARRHVAYRLEPDHYADRFRASGECQVAPASGGSGGSVRTVTGVVKVKALVVGGAVERAIVSGLRDHLVDEAAAVGRFVAEQG